MYKIYSVWECHGYFIYYLLITYLSIFVNNSFWIIIVISNWFVLLVLFHLCFFVLRYYFIWQYHGFITPYVFIVYIFINGSKSGPILWQTFWFYMILINKIIIIIEIYFETSQIYKSKFIAWHKDFFLIQVLKTTKKLIGTKK